MKLRFRLLLVLTIAAILPISACGNRQDPTTLEPEGGYGPRIADDRSLVARVTTLELQKAPGGTLILAIGQPDTLAYWDPDLVQIKGENVPAGTLRFEFRARPPISPKPAGTALARRIEVAAFVSDQEMRGIRRIEVLGATESRAANR